MNMEDTILQINVDDIIPNRFQPRIVFDKVAMQELIESIKEHGIIQPIVVRRVKDLYEIIAGERRYKASLEAGLKTVPCIVTDIDDNDSAEIALIENIQRKELSAIEEAKAYKKILDKQYLTQETLARKLGKSQSSLSNKLRLLKLPEKIQNALLNEIISEKHARILLTLENEKSILEFFEKITKENLTSRQLEMEINKFLNTEDSFTNNWIDKINTPSFLNNEIHNLEAFNDFNDYDNKNNKNDVDIDFKEFSEFDSRIKEKRENFIKKENDIKVAVNTLMQTIKTLENHGYKVKTEDFDFEDIHQIVVSIQK